MFAASLGSHLCKEDNLTDKIPGLQDIFGGIYSAIVESQNTIEQHYLDEIKKDYFDESCSPKMVRVQLPANDGKLHDMDIPAITLVPHHGLKIKEVSLRMKVALGHKDDDEKTEGKGAKLRKLVSGFRGRSEEMSTIKIKFEGTDPPEGIARIKDSLVKFIPT